MSDLVIANKSDLVSIADAIREKARISDGLVFPDGFMEAISELEVGSISTLANGEFVSAEDVSGKYRIYTNLGRNVSGDYYCPDNCVFVLWLDQLLNSLDKSVLTFAYVSGDAPILHMYGGINGLGKPYLQSGSQYIDYYTNTYIVEFQNLSQANYAMTIKAGYKYKWAVFEVV